MCLDSLSMSSLSLKSELVTFQQFRLVCLYSHFLNIFVCMPESFNISISYQLNDYKKKCGFASTNSKGYFVLRTGFKRKDFKISDIQIEIRLISC